MIYLSLWSIVLFNQYPDNWTIVGAMIIVVSGLIIWLREKRHAQRKSVNPQPVSVTENS